VNFRVLFGILVCSNIFSNSLGKIRVNSKNILSNSQKHDIYIHKQDLRSIEGKTIYFLGEGCQECNEGKKDEMSRGETEPANQYCQKLINQLFLEGIRVFLVISKSEKNIKSKCLCPLVHWRIQGGQGEIRQPGSLFIFPKTIFLILATARNRAQGKNVIMGSSNSFGIKMGDIINND